MVAVERFFDFPRCLFADENDSVTRKQVNIKREVHREWTSWGSRDPWRGGRREERLWRGRRWGAGADAGAQVRVAQNRRRGFEPRLSFYCSWLTGLAGWTFGVFFPPFMTQTE